MIPKIIHYCWLSDEPIPIKMQECMESWKKKLPEYKIVHWNFDRFPRSNSKWVDDAFRLGKYAFAADYIRLYALYNYGGIYLDMDVEVCKPYGDMLTLNTMLGYENSKTKGLEVAAFGVVKHSPWVKKCLDYYDSRNFVNDDGTLNIQPLPGVIKKCLIEYGFMLKDVDNIEDAISSPDNVIPVFPCEFFSPKNHDTGKIKRSEKTYSIHHFAGSWTPTYQQVEAAFWHSLGLRDMRILLRIINLIKFGTIKSQPKYISNNK